MNQTQRSSTSSTDNLVQRFRAVREFSEQLAAPLTPEDCAIQSMPDASPTKWHLAHTTWFFETFLLQDQPGYSAFNKEFAFLFNSYYNTVGKQFPRPQRGILSRPALSEIFYYRASINEHMQRLLADGELESKSHIVEIGLQHEQQHQELLLTDIKHVFAQNPLQPSYQDETSDSESPVQAAEWLSFDEGLYEIGHTGNGFCFDNELPRHPVFLQPFELSGRLVTCGEFLEFINDGGYSRPEFWLSQGWSTVCERNWSAPFYWSKNEAGQWTQFTLAGRRAIMADEPVCHLSYFEADAFARWAGARLPTEAEWEVAASVHNGDGNVFADRLLSEGRTIHPQREIKLATDQKTLAGNVWQWTSSQYTAYPGYAPPDGALGEYNGKFMCNQFVLRGGSCATSSSHIRASYRNFFPPDAQWQFSGLRLARDV